MPQTCWRYWKNPCLFPKPNFGWWSIWQTPLKQERQRLLAAIGKLVIADDTVLPQEHALLDDYYALIAKIPARPEKHHLQVETVGKFVRKVARTVRDLSAGY